jgi:hypothetical protein
MIREFSNCCLAAREDSDKTAPFRLGSAALPMRSTAFLLVALASCQTHLPRLEPLTLRDYFEVAYSGDAAPATLLPAQLPAKPEAVAAASRATNLQTVEIKATTVELDIEGARQLLSALRAQDAEQGESATTERRQSKSTAAMPLAALGGAHLDGETIESILERLRGRADVLSSPRIAALFGEEAKISISDQRSVISALDFKAMDAAILADPRVGMIEYGDELAVRATDGKDGKRLHVQWRISRPALPVPVVQTSVGALQTPVIIRHELVASPVVGERDCLAFASLPSGSDNTVLLLFVELALLTAERDAASK